MIREKKYHFLVSFLWLMGRSPSLRRLSDKLHWCIARGFPFLSSLWYPAIKKNRSDQAPGPRDFQPEPDHPFHGICADRPTDRDLYVSSSRDMLLSGTLPFQTATSIFYFFTSTGTRRGVGEREEGTRAEGGFFVAPVSGRGNPGYAIHRVVEPEIDHI